MLAGIPIVWAIIWMTMKDKLISVSMSTLVIEKIKRKWKKKKKYT